MLTSISWWAAEIHKVCHEELTGLKNLRHTFDGYRILDRYRALQLHIDAVKKNPIKTFETDNNDGEDI